VTEYRYFLGGLIELKCATCIRGSLGTLGPREIKKKRRMHLYAPSFDDTSVFIDHRVDLDCIVPYLTLAKSTRLPILLCKIRSLAGASKRTVRHLRRGVNIDKIGAVTQALLMEKGTSKILSNSLRT
jgi:hypothetical protein